MNRIPAEVALLGGAVPFVAFRRLLDQLPATVGDDIRASLPFLMHGRSVGVHVARVKSELRHWHRSRCIAAIAGVAWRLRDAIGDTLTIRVSGVLSDADLAVFTTLMERTPIILQLAPASGLVDAGLDADSSQVAADMTWIAGSLKSPVDWAEFRQRLHRYIRCGDSWTARWLAEAALQRGVALTAEAADLLGLIFQMQERSRDAEVFYRIAFDHGGPTAARAAYSLAMLYSRHHPKALRDPGVAMGYLDAGWVLLAEESADPDVVLDRALNRNGAALLLQKSGNSTKAVAVLVDAIALLGADGKHGQARAILLHNLGRLHAATPGSEAAAEQVLRESLELDGSSPEYWLEFARFLAGQDRFADAETAAVEAEAACDHMADIPALRGYLATRAGHPAAAAEHYARAAQIDPLRPVFALAAARAFGEADDYPAVREWLGRILPGALKGEEAVEAQILGIEAASFLEDLTEAEIIAQLQELVPQHPDSVLLAENLKALAGAGR